MINEPTAAAIYFAFQKQANDAPQIYLIFDFGGGTLDISIVEISASRVLVKAFHGNSHLGGCDFDVALMDHIMSEIEQEYDVNLRGNTDKNAKAKAKIRKEAKTAKEMLSNKNMLQTDINIESIAGGEDYMTELTRADFERICEPVFCQIIPLIDATLAKAGHTRE